jgi:hypothetical protein
MRRRARAMALATAIVAGGCLAAGCGQSGNISAGSSPSRAASLLPSHSPAFSPSGAGRASGGVAAPSALPSAERTRAPAEASSGSGIVASEAPPSAPGVAASAPPSPAAGTPASGTPASAPSSAAAGAGTAAPPTAATPASSAPTTQPASSSPAQTGGSSSVPYLWLWILLGVLAAAGVIAWIIYASRRRSARRRLWRARVVDAYAKGSAVADAMRMMEGPGARGAPDGDARWADIQRRVDDFDQTLYGLRATAPGGPELDLVAEVITNLQAVRSVMEARSAAHGPPDAAAGPGWEALPGPGWKSAPRRGPEPDRLEGRLRAFEASLMDLRDAERP